MKSISGEWVGKILGTNNADIFVEIEQSNSNLSGSVRINDPMFGMAIYSYSGNLSVNDVVLEMDPKPESFNSPQSHTAIINGKTISVDTEGVSLGHVSVKGTLVEEGRIEGKWNSSIGTGGTFWITRANSRGETVPRHDEAIDDNVAFIMMNISLDDPSLEDFLQAIKRATSQYDIQGVRVDEIEHSKKITDVVLDKIRSSRFLICDITNERPNVYYELGFAHGIGKEVILIAKVGTPLHFDIKDYNVIFYKNYTDLEDRVAKRIEEAINAQQENSADS